MNKFAVKSFLFLLISCTFIFSQSTTVDNSRFINQSVPDRMTPGQTYELIFTFENNGTTYWTPGDYRIRVSSDGSSMGTVWAPTDMDFVRTIEPGNTATFQVKVTAPSSEGVYPIRAQLLHGSYNFGESSKPSDITVSIQVNIKEALNSAAFVEQTVPTVMETGKPYKVLISMTNTGKTVWTPGMYRLVMLDAAGNSYTGSSWNTYSVGIDESITPSGSKVFNFEIIPLLPGTYTMQWRMASSETGLFGDVTNPAVVTVNKIEVKKNEGKRGKE